MNTNKFEKLEKETPKYNLDIRNNIKHEKDLYDMLKSDKFDFDQWISMFDEYEKQYSRFFYSHISQYIFDEPDDTIISKILQNITIVTRKISINDEVRNKRSQNYGIENKKCEDGRLEVSYNKYSMIFKLYDHCHLAYGQRKAYKATKTDIEDTIQNISELKIDEHKNEIESKIKEYEKSITSQLIGLISIFTALSFLLFGGISSFGNIFTIVRTVPLGKLLIILDIWFICMFNLFALFIQMIAMVTDKQFKIKMYLLIVNAILVTTLFVLTVLHILKTILPPFLL